MKIKAINQTNPICSGIGLLALDVILNGDSSVPPLFFAGGSCGNVLSILSYLGWQTFPIARLKDNNAAKIILEDLSKCKVNGNLISVSTDGSTPIIIHRILKDKLGNPKHRFEFRDPDTGKYLPSFKGVLSDKIQTIFEQEPRVRTFYIDRVNRASIELAKKYKDEGAFVILEPPSIGEIKLFNECLKYTDILKFSSERIPDFKDMYPVCQAEVEIETAGAEGARFRVKNQKEWIFLRSFEQERVLDAAGAGDWCTAGIIHYLFSDSEVGRDVLRNIDTISEAINFGQLLGSINCMFIGARGLMYVINSVDFFSLLSKIQESEDFSIFDSLTKRPSLQTSISSKMLHQLY